MTADSRPQVLPEAVLDAMAGAVAQISLGGEILGVNATWRTLADLSDLLPGTNVTAGANYIAACEQAAATGVAAARDATNAMHAVLEGATDVASFEYTLAGRHTTRSFELIVSRLEGNGFHGALVRHVDITARKAESMESLGRLAGGVAHDLNNLLTVMIGYAELLHTSDETPPACRAPVAEILGAGRRAAELTGRLLAFARKQRVEPREVNVKDPA